MDGGRAAPRRAIDRSEAMPATRTTLKALAAALAIAGASAGVLAYRAHTPLTVKEAVDEAMKRGDYPSAAGRAKAFVDANPRDLLAYGAWIAALAMANRMEEAREAMETAKKVFPEHVEQYEKPVTEVIEKIESGHRTREEAESAEARGLPHLAARKYAEAHELLLEDPKVGLKAARTWAIVHEDVKAALMLRKVAEKGDPAVAREADAFLAAHKGVLTSAAASANEEGWKILEAIGEDLEGADKAKDAFKRAIALRPDHAGLAESRVEGAAVTPMRSPYIGLAMAQAVTSTSWELQGTLTKAAANGVPAPSGPLSGRAGTALGTAFCSPSTLEVLEGVYGERASVWGKEACERATVETDWQAAVDTFDKANKAGVAPAESLSGFEEAKGLFSKDWDARFPAAAYAGRSTCNIAYLNAWLATFAAPMDLPALDKAVAASAACPTDDFNRKRLDEKVAAVRDKAGRGDAFTLRVCNRSTEDKVRIAYMRTKAGSTDDLTLKGWWDLDKGKCQDLPGTFAGAEQAEVYLTAYSQSFTWWPWEKADTSACVPTGKVDRVSSPGEIACSDGEDLRGFLKLAVRKGTGKTVLTYNIKNPG
jgi:tetratricopeptide (TPR) repeat protein